MAINKIFWKELLVTEEFISGVNCPICKEGHLRITKNLFQHSFYIGEKNEKYIKINKNYYFEEARFTCLLECTNVLCRDVIACCGYGYADDEDYIDPESDELDKRINIFFKPLYFTPPIQIIPLKETYPIKINSILNDSFKLFFCDSEACANKIRTVVEELMDIYKIRKTLITKKRKRRYLTLGERIEEYSIIDKENAKLLRAIKWIGNEGSHNSKIIVDDTLDAYEMLEHVLNKIYDNEEKKVESLAKAINKKKAPRSKIRKRM